MEKITDYSINSRIVKLIELLKLTPNSFANKLNVSSTLIYNIEKNRNKPSYDIILAISETFSVDCNWLILGIGKPFFMKDILDIYKINVGVLNRINVGERERSSKIIEGFTESEGEIVPLYKHRDPSISNNENPYIINNGKNIIYDTDEFLNIYHITVGLIQKLYGIILKHGDKYYLTAEMLEEFKTFKDLASAQESVYNLYFSKDQKEVFYSMITNTINKLPEAFLELIKSVNVLGMTVGKRSRYEEGTFVHFEIEDLKRLIAQRDSDV